jgi:hypothetical protein
MGKVKSYAKEIALIGLLTALNVAVNVYIPLFVLYVFVILAFVLKPRQACSLGVLTGVLQWFVNGKIMSLTNVIFLPLIALAIYAIRPKLFGGTQCASGSTYKSNLILGAYSFIIIFLLGVISEIITTLVYGTGVAYVIASLPLQLILAVANALLIGFTAIWLYKRIAKVLLKLGL